MLFYAIGEINVFVRVVRGTKFWQHDNFRFAMDIFVFLGYNTAVNSMILSV